MCNEPNGMPKDRAALWQRVEDGTEKAFARAQFPVSISVESSIK